MMNWKPKVDPGKGLRVILLMQLGLAGLLIASDVVGAFPDVYRKPAELPTGPVSPGDQRRVYRTDRPSPGLLTIEGPLELPLPQRFSDRLQFTEARIDGIGDVVLLSGGIEAGDAERFAAFLKALPAKPAMIALNSPGGVVSEAQEIGRIIRQEELSSAVPAGAFCMSSCPYVLAGGVDRTVSLRSVVGLHQHYYDQPKLLPAVFAVEFIQTSQGETMEFLIDMGVDPSLMIFSLKTPPDEIYALVESELTETRIATAIVD